MKTVHGIRSICTCVLLLCGAVRVVDAAERDVDRDGYVGGNHGGPDCVDQLSSVFVEGTPECDPAAPPVFLGGWFDIADHTWIEDASGLYHLFIHAGATSQSIYHFTAPDLQSLSLESSGPVLEASDGAWDQHALWSPQIVESEGVYFMFYTGTSGPGVDPTAVQRIGVATSTDLFQWTKYPINDCDDATGDGCVYDCDELWTAWSNGGPYDAQCRDPFVLRDDDNGHWVMFATARLDVPGTQSDAIVVATSTDLLHWTGAGYIEATKTLSGAEGGILGQRWGGVAENAFVTRYDTRYYLTFTDWHDEDPANPDCADSTCSMVQVVTSRSLDASPDGSANWEYLGYTPDRGVNAIEVIVRQGDTWIQSQSVANANSGDWLEHSRDLRLKRVVWHLEAPDYETSNLTDLACRVASADINPGMPEICNDTIDNDCSGAADDAVACQCVDADGDGYGAEASLSCTFFEADCDDTRMTVYPGAREICDGIDNDCNGEIDEASTCWRDRKRPAQRRTLENPDGTPTPGATQPHRSSRARLLLEAGEEAGPLEIRYSIGATADVNLQVFDVAGRCVRTLRSGRSEPGHYRVRWNRLDTAGSRIARGIYIVRLSTGEHVVTRKFVNLR